MILIFDRNSMEAELLRGAVTAMGFSARIVEESDCGQPLGVLAGENLMGFPGGLNREPEVPVMVLCHLTEGEIDTVLSDLRQSGLGKNVRKAILTPTNRFWTAAVLAQELEKERIALLSDRGASQTDK